MSNKTKTIYYINEKKEKEEIMTIEYQSIVDYGDSQKIQFTKCGHTNCVKSEHLEQGNFICNTCSNLLNWDYFYDTFSGLVHKSSIVRQCKVCKEKDSMSDLACIPRYGEKVLQFWFYHEKCLELHGFDINSTKELINNPNLKSKSIIKHSKTIEKPKKTPKSLKDYKLTDLSTKGDFTEGSYNIIEYKIPKHQECLYVLNKTQYDLNTIGGVHAVYAIHNTINNKRYIGSTSNLGKRLVAHLRELRRDKHHSNKLQLDFNLYEESCFVYEILEIFDSNIETKELRKVEQRYITQLHGYFNGYNIHPRADFNGSASSYNLSKMPKVINGTLTVRHR